jgi:hypothetical protein
MPKSKKKKGKKYDYKKIAKQTRGQVKASSKRKGSSAGSVFNADVNFTKFTPAVDVDHSIDFIPFECGDSMPWDFDKGRIMAEEGQWHYTFEYWRHNGIGPLENQRVMCPEKTWKEPCPICEHRRELDAEKAFDKEKMGSMIPKRRNLYNVVCYDSGKEEDKGVQLFDVTWHWFEKYTSKLAGKAVRRRRGSKVKVADPFKNFADPSKNGVSVEWSIEGAKSKNDFDDWMNHQLIQRDYDLDEGLLDAALQLDQIVEHLTYAELYQKYYDEPYEGEEEEEEGQETSGRRRSRKRNRVEEDEPEDVEELEEEEEAPEEDEDNLDELDRKELKVIIKDEKIDFKVYKSTEDDEIRSAIQDARAEVEPEEEEEEEEPEVIKTGRRKKTGERKKTGKKKECPQGGTIGVDFEDFENCDNCKLWNHCDSIYQKQLEEED